MKPNKHTPGPWQTGCYTNTNKCFVTDCNGNHIYEETTDSIGFSEVTPTAHLIAAAPELFSAVEFLLDSFPGMQTDSEISGADVIEHLSNHWDIFIKAIAKARGES
jgi:hypothetical protein